MVEQLNKSHLLAQSLTHDHKKITINTLVFKDTDKKFNPKSTTTLDRDDKKLVRFIPTCGLGFKGA